MSYPVIQKLNTAHRVVDFDQTYQRVLPILDLIRASAPIDITDCRFLSIPTYAVSVEGHTAYGKGADHLQSQVSAMMEAVERYIARRLPPSTMLAKYAEMRQLHHILEPKTMIGPEVSIPDYACLEWIPGTDLITSTRIWVPAYYAVLKDNLAGPRLLKLRTTNGVASGNTFDEAVCHGLYELIERDAWTLAWLHSVTLPQMRHMAQSIKQGIKPGWNDSDFSPNVDEFPLIGIESLPDYIRELISRFETAGMTVIIRNITSDIGIATFLVGCRDDHSDYYGMGTHLRSDIAIVRAITECAQTYHIKNHLRQNCKSDNRVGEIRYKMAFSHSKSIEYSDIPSYNNVYLHDDIEMILSSLTRVGIDRVIAVDLTHKALGIPVVRVITPRLENWSTSGFSSDDCFLGNRGRQCIQPRND